MQEHYAKSTTTKREKLVAWNYSLKQKSGANALIKTAIDLFLEMVYAICITTAKDKEKTWTIRFVADPKLVYVKLLDVRGNMQLKDYANSIMQEKGVGLIYSLRTEMTIQPMNLMMSNGDTIQMVIFVAHGRGNMSHNIDLC